MRETKKKKLESRGWKVGSTADFLGLSPEEVAYIEIKLRLAEQLRRRRKRRKLSQVKLALLVGSSQSRVAKMESGDPSVSIDLLVRSLLALGASDQELARMFASATRRLPT